MCPNRTTLCSLLILVVLCGSACDKRVFRGPTFKGPTEAERHLTTNQVAFTRFAEEWAEEHPKDEMFCYFDEGSYRWGRIFIDRDNSGFSVGRGSAKRIVVPTLAEAAQRPGTTGSMLTSWINRAKALRVYCVESSSATGVVEIMLEGSEWLPYGLRYAPDGSTRAYDSLVFYSKQNGAPGDVALRLLHGQWFYFEGRR